MATQIKSFDDKMQVLYDKLASNLSEATVNPEAVDKKLGYPKISAECRSISMQLECFPSLIQPTSIISRNSHPRKKRDELQLLYIQTTKLDVGLNGMLQRSKTLSFFLKTYSKEPPILGHAVCVSSPQPPHHTASSTKGYEASCDCSWHGKYPFF